MSSMNGIRQKYVVVLVLVGVVLVVLVELVVEVDVLVVVGIVDVLQCNENKCGCGSV